MEQFEMKTCDVYIYVDSDGRIEYVNSSPFMTVFDGWRQISSGFDKRHHHAQGYFFPKPLHDERKICLYMTALLTDDPDRAPSHVYDYEGQQWGIYERTQAEMDADWVEPVPQPDTTERIADLEAAMAAIEEGIASV